MKIKYFLFLLLLLFASTPVSAQTSWLLSTADSKGDVGSYSSLTIDAEGKKAISYYDATNGDLKFARKIDNTWQRKTVDADMNVGQYSSITTISSPTGTPVTYLISYYDVDNKDLKFAKSTDGGKTWQTKTVDSAGDVGQSTSISVDRNGYYLISYYNADHYILKLAKSVDGGNTWIINTSIREENSGPYSSITTDLEGNYLLSYSGFRSMRFAKSIDGGNTWSTNIIDLGIDRGITNAIKADPFDTNFYLISYIGTVREVRTIRFAISHDKGQTWTFQIFYGVSAGDYTSMAIGKNREYLISFNDNDLGDLKFAKSTDKGETWILEPVDTIENVGQHNSLAVDPLGKYVISYYDTTNGNLKLAVSGSDPTTINK